MNVTFWLLMYFIVGTAESTIEVWQNGEEYYRDFLRSEPYGITDERAITAIILAAVVANIAAWPITIGNYVYKRFKKGGS